MSDRAETTREPERGPPFKPCPKCEALQDVALLCGPCADRFCDHLMADPAFAATMACAEDRLIDRAWARYSKEAHDNGKR